MEFIDKQKITQDVKAVQQTLFNIGELAKVVHVDGLNLEIKDIFDIATGRKSLASIYIDEANRMHSNGPKWEKENIISQATKAGNVNQKLVNDMKSSFALTGLQPDQFKMDKDFHVTFNGDLEKICTKNNTRILSPKQERLFEAVKSFNEAVKSFNTMLDQAEKPRIQIQIPFVTGYGEIDLQQILAVNFEFIETRKKELIERDRLDKENKAARLKEILNSIPPGIKDRQEQAEHFLATETTGIKHTDEWIKSQFKMFQD